MELRKGSTVGAYLVDGLLAEGGMAQVFLVRHMEKSTQHALKVLTIYTKSVQQRLKQEGYLQRLLQHENIVPVTDVVRVGHVPALVMDYVAGPDLAELLSHHRLTDPQINTLFLGVCRGVIAAHANGMIHRDLKPSNILMQIEEDALTPKITDFGLAKVWSEDPDRPQTQSGATMGTASYMAPEQIWDASTVDERADVFSLGAILYETLSGTRAFDGSHSVAIWGKITTGDFVPLSNARPDLPIEVIQTVHRAMAVDQSQRIPDVQELMKRWEHAIAVYGLPSAAAQPVWDSSLLAQARELLTERRKAMEAHSQINAALGEDLRTTISSFILGDFEKNSPSISPLPSRYSIEPPITLPPSNLPVQVDRFIGRKKELGRIRAEMQEARPVLTLSGPGGMGKTRLSLAFAEKYRKDFTGGVWFCDLTETRSEDDILSAVAHALQIPLSEKNPAMQLAHAINGRGPLLLVLDNMEQVVEHANDTVGMWARKAPQARFLVTSRVRLGLQSERVQVLGPLDPEDGILLFEERAKAHDPDFSLSEDEREVAGKIVACLDGMCLAIELAAARSRLLRPTQILSRLDERFKLLRGSDQDRPSRQSTLRGAIDWSWDLLGPIEQVALTQCSIFRGGFTLAAAEEVLDLESFSEWTLDVIQRLVEQSLIRTTEPIPGIFRFQMYESIREYALAKMAAPGSIESDQDSAHTGPSAIEALAHRHSSFYAQMGEPERIESDFRCGSSESRSTYRLESDNLLHAMAFGQRQPSAEIQALATRALAEIHHRYGPLAPALEWVLTCLKRDNLSPRWRVLLSSCASDLQWELANIDESIQSAVEALEVARIFKDPLIIGRALTLVAERNHENMSFAERTQMLTEALALIPPTQDARAKINAVLSLGTTNWKGGQADLGYQQIVEALELSRANGLKRPEARALRIRAGYYMDIGKLPLAETYLKESLVIAEQIDLSDMIVKIYQTLGTLYKDMGRLEDSVQAHKEGIQICRTTGAMRDECILLGNLALILQLQGKFDEAQMLYEDTLALTEATGMVLVGHMAQGNLGDLLLSQGKLEESVARFEMAIAGMDERRNPAGGAFRGSLAWVRAQLGEFETAMELLDKGEAQLRGVWLFELGRILCRRAQVLHTQGDSSGAGAAIEEARTIASQHGGTADSDLGQLIVEAEGTMKG